MNLAQARNIIDKYLKGECAPEERKILEDFLNLYQLDNENLRSVDFDEEIKAELWLKISNELTADPVLKVRSNGRSLILNVFKVAAVITTVAIGVGIWPFLSSERTDTLIIPDDKIVIRTGSDIIDQIDIGEFAPIKSSSGESIASQEGDVIIYNSTTKSTKLIYNEIEVPRGKKIKLILSDGTLVHLNSNTKLKFPVDFLANEDRQVFLEGEAYFEVTKDTSRPFKVTTTEVGIKVFGTHFNVSSYTGSPTHTILMEGSVSVQMILDGVEDINEQILIPGQKATLHEGIFEMKKVNVNDYLGWMQDMLVFDDESFEEIIKEVERNYNVEIQNNYKSLDTIRFNGKFKEETVIDLLETFKESAGFEYIISNNKVIINRP